jgi:transmembrane sensor
MNLDETTRTQAAEWFSAQRRGMMSADERVHFDQWRASDTNAVALDSMGALWGELAGLKGVMPLPARQRRRFPLGIAASLLLAAVAGAVMLPSLNGRLFSSTLRTAIGEQRTQALPDGSVAQLNVQSRIDYRVNPRRRDVTLQYGEALFMVRKDASLPFIVHAAGYDVRAVGTAFDVRHRDQSLQVDVLEGTVLVKALAGSQAGHEVARLTAGDRLVISDLSAPGGGPRVEQVPVQTMSEWRQREVSYQDLTVEQVVTDLNRFFERPLEVSDPMLAQRRVTLHLQIEDRERVLQTLGALLGANIQRGARADVLTETR